MMKKKMDSLVILIDSYIKLLHLNVEVDPFEPPMPPKTDPEMIRNMAESFAKGQPYAKRIGLTLYTNQVNAATATLKSVQNKLKTTLTGSKE
jgi:hypothetical protein